MKHVVYLNRRGAVYHVIVAAVAEEDTRNVTSRICTSVEEARQLVEKWKSHFSVAPGDIVDNSRLDLNELLGGVETDFNPSSN